MEQLVLKPLEHRGQVNIGLYFDYKSSLNQAVRKIAQIRWSKTYKCWYVPLSKENYNCIVSACKEIASIEQSALQKYLADKKNQSDAIIPKVKTTTVPVVVVKHSPPAKKTTISNEEKIHPVNAHVLTSMEMRLKLKAYSSSTIKTYLNEMSQLLQTIRNIPADDLTVDHLKRYLVYCYEKIKLSENTLHSRINAMKFYYEQVLHREKFFWEIPRPKKQLLLPRFFSQADIIEIIKATENVKHKMMLMLGYGAGLRVSEVVAMRTRNIDSSRMTILVEQAKGKKDRMVMLSPVLLVLLREYLSKYKPDPNGYLFSGQNPGEPYSTRTLQIVLAEAKKKAGILKPGSVHALRHSFATHLLDRGTDVTLIMKLLGHNDIKTTLRYLHVTNRDLLQVFSPLDDLKLE